MITLHFLWKLEKEMDDGEGCYREKETDLYRENETDVTGRRRQLSQGEGDRDRCYREKETDLQGEGDGCYWEK
jgi:hypothetical protein